MCAQDITRKCVELIINIVYHYSVCILLNLSCMPFDLDGYTRANTRTHAFTHQTRKASAALRMSDEPEIGAVVVPPVAAEKIDAGKALIEFVQSLPPGVCDLNLYGDTCMNTHMAAYIHTHTCFHTYIHACIHTYTHTHAHMRVHV